jgi:hypothetical protein
MLILLVMVGIVALIVWAAARLARAVIHSTDREAALAASDLDRWLLIRDGSGIAALMQDGFPVAEFGDPDRASRGVLRRAAVIVSRETETEVSAYRLSPSLYGFRAE